MNYVVLLVIFSLKGISSFELRIPLKNASSLLNEAVEPYYVSYGPSGNPESKLQRQPLQPHPIPLKDSSPVSSKACDPNHRFLSDIIDSFEAAIKPAEGPLQLPLISLTLPVRGVLLMIKKMFGWVCVPYNNNIDGIIDKVRRVVGRLTSELS